MRRVRLVGVVLFVALYGCGRGDTTFCTADLRTSVVLTVVDNANAPLAGATVSYQVDGGAGSSLVCDFPGATGVCGLGQEIAGAFSIVVSKAGYTSASGSVTVARDECHVITERLTLVLTPQG